MFFDDDILPTPLPFQYSVGLRRWSSSFVSCAVEILSIEGVDSAKHTTFSVTVMDDGQSWTLTLRYSELRSLYERLQDFITRVPLPKFPPKGSFWENETAPDFLEHRRLGLESFLLALLNDSRFRSLPLVLRFFDPLINRVAVHRTLPDPLPPVPPPLSPAHPSLPSDNLILLPPPSSSSDHLSSSSSNHISSSSSSLSSDPPPSYSSAGSPVRDVAGVPSLLPGSSPLRPLSTSTSTNTPPPLLLLPSSSTPNRTNPPPSDLPSSTSTSTSTASTLPELILIPSTTTSSTSTPPFSSNHIPPPSTSLPGALSGDSQPMTLFIPTVLHQLPLPTAAVDLPPVLLLSDSSEFFLGSLLDELRELVGEIYQTKRNLDAMGDPGMQLAALESLKERLNIARQSLDVLLTSLQELLGVNFPVVAQYANLQHYLEACIQTCAASCLWASRIEGYLMHLISQQPSSHQQQQQQEQHQLQLLQQHEQRQYNRQPQLRNDPGAMADSRFVALVSKAEELMSRALRVSSGARDPGEFEALPQSSSAPTEQSVESQLETVADELSDVIAEIQRYLGSPVQGEIKRRLKEIMHQLAHTKSMILNDPGEKVRRLESAVFQLLSDANNPISNMAEAKLIKDRMTVVSRQLTELKHDISKSKQPLPSLINQIEDLQENMVDLQHRYSLHSFDFDQGITENAAELLRQRTLNAAKKEHSQLEDEMFEL